MHRQPICAIFTALVLLCSCHHRIDHKDVITLAQKYYAGKYKVLQGNGLISTIDSFSSAGVKSLLVRSASNFTTITSELGLHVLSTKSRINVDSVQSDANSATAFVKEELTVTLLRHKKTGTDTIHSIYNSFYTLRMAESSNNLVIVSEKVQDFDPLFIQKTPKVSSQLFQPAQILAAAGIVYDRDKAIAYADRYFANPNPQYCNYDLGGGDCTNFVSQCVNEGGWLMSDSWKAQGAGCCKNILGCGVENCYTCSWTVAHEFFLWLPGSGRVEPQCIPMSDLRPGDIVQADFNGDGHIDHSMLVTDIDGNVPFVTYRSAGNRSAAKEVPVNQIPSDVLYCFHVKDKY